MRLAGRTALVTGVGSTWNSSADIVVGNEGRGSLTIADGARVSSVYGSVGNGSVGGGSGSDGSVTVTGPGLAGPARGER